MQKKIKIVILVGFVDGGTGTFLLQLHKLEKVIKQKVEIRTFVLGKAQFRKLRFKRGSISYFSSLPYPSKYRVDIKTLCLFIKELIWLNKKLRSFQPTIIISVDTHANLLSSLIKTISLRKIYLILTIHNNIKAVVQAKLSPFLSNVLRLFGSILFRTADTIVTISYGSLREIQKFFFLSQHIVVIPYGISIRKNNQSRKTIKSRTSLFTDNETKKIISIGRFEKQKDFETLIQAHRLLINKMRNCRLILVGNGSQKKTLQKLVRKFNLKKNVSFLGWKNNIYSLLRKADVFVLSSKYEGFGRVLLEAMSEGLPVISTNVPYGPAEILENGKYGILVPPNNEKKMANKIYSLFKKREKYKYFVKASLQRVKFYSEDLMLERYSELILNSINE